LQNNPATPAVSSPAAEPAHPWRGYFFIASATLCWGGAATFGKAIFSGNLFSGRALISPMVLTQARASFTVLVLAPLLLMRFGQSIFRIRKNDLALCALVGTLGVGCSNYFYYLAVQKATVSLAITVQYTAPVWVLLYMVLRGREKATLQRALAALIAMLGTALAIGLFHSDIKLSSTAVSAALLASFGYAFYNVAGQGLVTRNHQLTIMFYVLLSAALMWQVVNPPWRLVQQHYTRGQWEFLFVFACLSMVLPYMLYFTGLRYLDPTRAVITSCLEPVFAILFAVTFRFESLRPLQVLGIVAVLAATVMVQVKSKDAALPEVV
jgi:drug/metabolite transporter (DMT)-like permease